MAAALTVRLALVATLLTSILGELRAQAVRGELIQRDGRIPVEGAFVLLVDARGVEVARALTGPDGRFTLRAATPGSYLLVAKRVGFKPTTSPRLTLEPGGTLSYQLALEAVPIDLAAVVVEGDRQCDMRSASGGTALAALWNEIREALAAAAWTAREPGYWYESTVFERDLEGRRVVSETRTPRAGYYRAAFASVSVAELNERGYVRWEDDEWVFFAPDAQTLLSDAFLRTHCFEVQVGKNDNAGLFGLSFSPGRGSDVPDVHGALWVDRETSELKYLDYAYARLPLALAGYRGGGRVSFRRVPSGAWIVDDWVIRMPLAESTRLGRLPSPPRTREAGGRVLVIKRWDGTVLHSAPVATVEGIVFDSLAGEALAGATVALVGTAYTARTDSAGRFRVAAPLDGHYVLTFVHRRLDSLAFRPERVDVDLRPGTVTAARLAIPSDASIIAQLCPDTVVRPTERVVVGAVREAASGRAFAGAEVRATWQEARARGGAIGVRDWQVETQADQRGSYTLCALPLDRPVTLVARFEGREGTPVRLADESPRAVQPRIRRQDLEAPNAIAPVVASTAGGGEGDTLSRALTAVGFYDRRRGASGSFITRQEFARWSPATTTEVLARMPGVRATPRGRGQAVDIPRGAASIRLNCSAAVVVDGNTIGSAAEIDIDGAVPVDDVAAIEVYSGPADVPARFGRTGTACGLIVIWTGR